MAKRRYGFDEKNIARYWYLLARKVLRCDFAEPLTARRLSDFSLAEAGIQDRGMTG